MNNNTSTEIDKNLRIPEAIVTLIVAGVQVANIRAAQAYLKGETDSGSVTMSPNAFKEFRRLSLGPKKNYLDKKSVEALAVYNTEEIEAICEKAVKVYKDWTEKRETTQITKPVVLQMGKADKAILAFCALNSADTISTILPQWDSNLQQVLKTKIQLKFAVRTIRHITSGVDNYSTGAGAADAKSFPLKLFDQTIKASKSVIDSMTTGDWKSATKNILTLGLGKSLSNEAARKDRNTEEEKYFKSGDFLKGVIKVYMSKNIEGKKVATMDSSLDRSRALVAIALYVVCNLRAERSKNKGKPIAEKPTAGKTAFNSFISLEKDPKYLAKEIIKMEVPNDEYVEAEAVKQGQAYTVPKMTSVPCGFIVHNIEADGTKGKTYQYMDASEVLKLIWENEIAFKAVVATDFTPIGVVTSEDKKVRIAVDLLFKMVNEKLTLSFLALEKETVLKIGWDPDSLRESREQLEISKKLYAEKQRIGKERAEAKRLAEEANESAEAETKDT